MIQSKFSLFKELEQLQVDGSLTDTCLVGASSKVFIHRAMLFADHIQPDSVWYQLDPGEGDGSMVVIVPDASGKCWDTWLLFTTITAPFNIS